MHACHSKLASCREKKRGEVGEGCKASEDVSYQGEVILDPTWPGVACPLMLNIWQWTKL